jgi:hypothetical protein
VIQIPPPTPPVDIAFAIVVERQVAEWAGPMFDPRNALPPLHSQALDTLASRDYEARRFAYDWLTSIKDRPATLRAVIWGMASLDAETLTLSEGLYAAIVCPECNGWGICPTCGGRARISKPDDWPDEYCRDCWWNNYGPTSCRACKGTGRP